MRSLVILFVCVAGHVLGYCSEIGSGSSKQRNSVIVNLDHVGNQVVGKGDGRQTPYSGKRYASDDEVGLRLGVRFFGINLEDEKNYFDSFTDLAIRAQAALEYKMDDYNTVNVGGYASRDFYDKNKINDYDLWLNYGYEVKFADFGLGGAFGLIPREAAMKYHDHIESDRFRFYNPSIKGLIISYENKWGRSEAMLDWYGGNGKRGIMSVDHVRFGANNRYNIKDIITTGVEIVFHHQKDPLMLMHPSFNNKEQPTILDQMAYRLYMDGDVGKFIGLPDNYGFTVGLGYNANAQRLRFPSYYHGFNNLGGLEAKICISYGIIGLRSSVYMGNAQMPYIRMYGNEAYNGLQYYNSNFLKISEAYMSIKRSEYVDIRFSVYIAVHKLTNTELKHLNEAKLQIKVDTRKFMHETSRK